MSVEQSPTGHLIALCTFGCLGWNLTMNGLNVEPSLTSLIKGNTGVLVLSILKDGPSHGYAIFFEIARLSNNVLQFKQGTVYPLLHALEDEGLIQSEWQETAPGNKRRRRVYSITDSGLKELDERLNAWRIFSKAMTDVTGSDASTKPT